MYLKFSLIIVIILFSLQSFADSKRNVHSNVLQISSNSKYKIGHQKFIHKRSKIRKDRAYSIKSNFDFDTLAKAPASPIDTPDLDYDKLLEIDRF